MRHLKIVSILDYVMAGFMGLGLLIVGAATLLSSLAVLSSGGTDALPALLPTLLINGFLMIVIAVLIVLCLLAGRQVSQGRGRMLQTILALMSVMNCPLGTAFAAYSLWVCWVNEETVPVFAGEVPVEL